MNPVSLPTYPMPFVGREEELRQLATLVSDPACRLLTLLGMGGIGKTRLAIEAARLQQDVFANGVYLITLQALSSPDFIIPAIAEAINFQFYVGGEPKQQLLDFLREKSLLLVLDNYEHLLADVTIVSDILAYASAVKIWITSRERLNLLEEWVLNVEGLPVPAGETEMEIDGYDAVQLFLQSAQRIQVGFKLTDAQKPAITRICRLVGGMPLGIELASAWVRAMSCEEIVSEIEHSLDILATPARNILPRHRTMRAVLEHSWSLLTEDERDVFIRLSVFWGGFRKEAAQYVAGASLTTLSALLDKSMVQVDRSGRYHMHELLRQYAREKFAEMDLTQNVLNRHRDYFLAFVESAEPELISVNQLVWFNRLETELGNLREAISWSLESGDIAAGLRLTGSLNRFWSERGYHREGYERLMNMLSLPQARVRTTLRTKALNAVGYIQWFEGNHAEARFLLEEASAIAREVEDMPQLALAVRFLGHVLYNLGEYEPAKVLLEESLTLTRKQQDLFGIAQSLAFLGDVVLQQGNTERAQGLYEESIDLLRELKDKALLAYVVRRLGLVMAGGKNNERSRALCQESLELNVVVGDRRGMAASLVGLSGIAIRQSQIVYAAQLLSAAEKLLNAAASHLLLRDQLEYQSHVKSVRNQLDTATFDSAWAEGQSKTINQAVSYALRKDDLEVERHGAVPLTARELEILHLMARGMSNRTIAETLILAVGTVKWHGSQICSKLQVQNRVQAIARARELNILL